MIRIFLTLISTLTVFAVQAAPTAGEVMRNCASALTRHNITIGFRITGSQSATGILAVSGRKFFLDTGRGKVWYDGSVMTTLNLNTDEATVTRPTAAEVSETFPLSYISTWSTDYNVAFASRQPKGGYCLVLTGKHNSAAARKAVLTVNATNFRPQKLVINLKSGKMATLTVTRYATGIPATAAGFRFPSRRYPKVKIVDLR